MCDILIKLSKHVFSTAMWFSVKKEWNWFRPCSSPIYIIISILLVVCNYFTFSSNNKTGTHMECFYHKVYGNISTPLILKIYKFPNYLMLDCVRSYPFSTSFVIHTNLSYFYSENINLLRFTLLSLSLVSLFTFYLICALEPFAHET